MGYALIVMAVAEECIPHTAHYGPTGAVIDAPKRFTLEVPRSAVWEPEPEPSDPNWHKDSERQREQTEKNRRSLERFLNNALSDLDGMVRSGWWILGMARVFVSEMRGVPPGSALASTASQEGRKRRPRRPEPSETPEPEPSETPTYAMRRMTIWGLDQKGKRVRSVKVCGFINPNQRASVIDTATARAIGGCVVKKGASINGRRCDVMHTEIKVHDVPEMESTPSRGRLRGPLVVSDTILKRSRGMVQLVLGIDHIGRTPLASTEVLARLAEEAVPLKGLRLSAQLKASIARSEVDRRAGRGIPHEEVLAALRKNWGERWGK